MTIEETIFILSFKLFWRHDFLRDQKIRLTMLLITAGLPAMRTSLDAYLCGNTSLDKTRKIRKAK